MRNRSKYYHADEVAKLLHCTATDVYNLIQENKLKAHRNGRRWLIDMDQPYLERFKRVTPPVAAKPVIQQTVAKPPFIEYIKDFEHQDRLFELIGNVQKSLSITTADIKNLFIQKQPLLQVLRRLARKRVKVRIICSRPLERIVDEVLNDPALLNSGYFEYMICSRNHMKQFIFDEESVYVGSANLTNAAIGGKNEEKRNFEAGIFTNDKAVLKQAMLHFHEVWSTRYCDHCMSQMCNHISHRNEIYQYLHS